MELKNLGQTAASALIHMDIRLEREHWTMFRQKLLGIAAAATLGSAAMLGSTAAYAVKIFDNAPNDRAALEAATENGSFTYAAETLLTSAVTEVAGDSTKYYDVGGSGTVVLSAPADVGADEGDIYLVAVTLDGMVFRTAPTIAVTDGTGSPAFSVATGGAAKDKMVVFRLTGGGLSATASNINVTASYAVSEGGGSATVTLTNQTLAGLGIAGVSGTMTHGPANVIKVESALKETPMANDLTAEVASSFKKFEGGMTVGNLGSITIGINGHRIATDGTGTTAVDGLEDIAATGQTTDTPAAANSSVSFMGNFSFTEKVYVHGDDDCGVEVLAADGSGTGVSAGTDTTLASAADDIRMMEGEGDAAMVTNTTKPVNLDNTPNDANDQLASFTGHLCIMVQGDDTDDMEAPRIPDTDAYTATASYKALTDAASGPMGMQRMLGEIDRDGTTIRMPYLSTNDKFNQRIRIVNRGHDARYEMEFHGTDDEPGMDASGTLDANSITVLSLRTDDVVTPGNGNNTSGTIIVEAQPGMIDVATVQVNRETGNTDTVVYSAGD